MQLYFHTITWCLSGLLLFGSLTILPGQERFPEQGRLFDNSTLARVDITMDADSLAELLMVGNEHNDHEYMATFTFSRDTLITTIDSVGFRLRGNTSRYAAKKSFKVSLNSFITGQKFEGVEKINLNGEHNDPSMSRALLSWYLFREAVVTGSRANHLRLYINKEYRGLYLNVEHVDEEFTDLRYGNNNGNLYKCLWPADLLYRGSSQDAYKIENDGRRAYELKQNTVADDYSDLVNFIHILNNTDPAKFQETLNRVFNINSFLKYMAVEVLTGHWDAYSYNKNNYYLYFNEGTGKFEFIPYDPDNTFGISWFSEDWTERDIYNWSHGGEPRPLMTKILQNETYRDRYSYYMHNLLQTAYNQAHLDPFLDSIRNQVLRAAADDRYRGQDYGYSYTDFYDAFELAAGAHVRQGIKPFIAKRSASALDQLEVNRIDPVITLEYVNLPGLYQHAEVEFLVEDDDGIEEVSIWFSQDDNFTGMYPVQIGNGRFRAIHPAPAGDGILKFYMVATDTEMNTTRDPVEGWYSIYYGTATSDDRSINSERRLTVYPNPASTQLNVRFSGHHNEFGYRILDETGRTVLEGYAVDVAYNLQLDDRVTDGFYILEVKYMDSGNSLVTEFAKFVVSK
ncbi:MAG: CotH kinase family protein [Bacteroidales bacterium]